MHRLLVVAVVAGCGFQVPGGGQDQAIDAGPLPPELDGSVADAELPDAVTGPQCPAGYQAIVGLSNSSRYRFVNTQLAWIDAERDCEDDADMMQRATHLIVLDDAAEKTAMITGLLGTTAINDQWIGLTDLLEEGYFEYVTNQSQTYSANPGGNAVDKDCVRIKDTGAEETRSCTDTNRYVCECDAIKAVPNQFPNLPNGNNGGR